MGGSGVASEGGERERERERERKREREEGEEDKGYIKKNTRKIILDVR